MVLWSQRRWFFVCYRWKTHINIGDEIGAFDCNENLIGSAVYNNDNLAITVWGDDELTKDQDGLEIGEKLNFVLFRNNESTEEKIIINSWSEGSGTYSINGISIANSMSSESLEERKLILITDLIGREVKQDCKQSVLLYYYNDGSIEKIYNNEYE